MEQLLDLLPDTMNLSSNAYRSYIYQPDRISLNSQDDITAEEQNTNSESFAGFTIRLASPCIKVKSLQLLRASIPTPVTNIPDVETTFWYYALQKNSTPGQPPYYLPAESNLRWVRLLPSYMPPELVGTQYAYNRTFTDYSDLVSELNKACQNDTLAGFNYSNSSAAILPGLASWVKSDISFVYNTTYNKIQMIGANSNLYYLPASYNDSNIFGSNMGAETLRIYSQNTFGLYGQYGQGQPYRAGYTLDLRLGWTWNGAPTTEENFRNLMRPVPTYTTGLGSFSNTLVNTANTYANLVYSGNCSIYLTLLVGSSLDSAGNSALLATVPLNATNNAIGFYNNVLSHPLRKIPEYIQEIQISLKDDNNQDFFLPNSAVVNFELGLSYT